MPPFRTGRYDYFLIWGHGLAYRDAILDLIRGEDRLSIVKILYHRPRSIRRLVDTIYSYDYAPYHHLINKTTYLLGTPAEVIFVFVENRDPRIDLFGEGAFRHEESLTIKALKEKIRDLYNPREGGKRTEDHVIHASDSARQTHYILKYLGYRNGIALFKERDRLLNTPYYIPISDAFLLKKVHIDTLLCGTARGDRYRYNIHYIPLRESPQYRGLTEDIRIYEEYITRFLGGPLTSDYSANHFLDLAKNLDYLGTPYENSFITTRKQGAEGHLIIDGLHRASILASRNVEDVIIAEVRS